MLNSFRIDMFQKEHPYTSHQVTGSPISTCTNLFTNIQTFDLRAGLIGTLIVDSSITKTNYACFNIMGLDRIP